MSIFLAGLVFIFWFGWCGNLTKTCRDNRSAGGLMFSTAQSRLKSQPSSGVSK